MKNQSIIIRTLILAALGAVAFGGGGCTAVKFEDRKMKLTTPLFSYEAETKGFSGQDKPAAKSKP